MEYGMDASEGSEGIGLSQQLSQVRLAHCENILTGSLSDWTVRSVRDDLQAVDCIQDRKVFNERNNEDDGDAEIVQDFNSQDFFCTPDFITPVEQQFAVDLEGSKENVPALGSLVTMTPMRVKRPRPDVYSTLLFSAIKDNSHRPSTPSVRDEATELEGLGDPEKTLESPTCLKNPFLPDSDTCSTQPRPKTSGLQGSSLSPGGLSRYRDDFHEIQEIGRGCFSRVYKAVNRIDGCFYAIKRSHQQLRQDSERKQALIEVQALAAIGPHRNIVRYHTAWFENDYLYIQTELCKCNLSELRVDGKLSVERSLVDALWQIAHALAAVHACGLAHLDVKPDNIYYVNGTYKLGDFGRAARLDGTTHVEEGDSRYTSAEILNDDYSSLHKADIFALGATMFELSRGLPLPSSGSQFQALRQGKLSLLPGYSLPYQHLLKDMMHPTPKLRPSAEELLKHSVFKKFTSKSSV